ncbi:MMPL family transporter [Nocardia sp. NPDC052001]|uniref:MMPL family transporter n=1 Tax=Nocardia sp. NPDC052001 TaxID=3154853 RepID=UPI00344051A9
MARYLYALGRFAARRRWWVLGIWIVLLAATVTVSITSGGKLNNDFTVPGTESQDVVTVLNEKLPAQGGASTQVVFATHGSAKVTDPDVMAAIAGTVTAFKGVPQVAEVIDPYQAKTIAPDGQVALSGVQYTAQAGQVEESTLDALRAAARTAEQAGVEVEYGGAVYPGLQMTIPESPEIFGLLAAFLILLITFGALVAAGLPIVTALIGVAIGVTGITALAALVDVPTVATSLALMLGLSCGIDYALFILSRHRNNLMQRMPIEESIGVALGTAGSAVVFAAVTVIVALCGLAVVGIPFLTVMGLTAAGAVLIAMLVALTLLPALLGFAGHTVTRFLPTPLRPGHNEKVARTAAIAPRYTGGHAWGRFVTRFRVPLLIGGVVLLGVAAMPVATMEFGLPSGGSLPTSSTARRAYDLISHSFGPGYNGPLIAVIDTSHATPDAVQTIAMGIQGELDVATVVPAAQANDTVLLQIIPGSGPNDSETASLVQAIRDHRESIEGSTGATFLIGGATAANIDTSQRLGDALPLFLAVVVGLAMVLLTLAFRTILVPITSIIGFVGSVFAALGIQVAVFQWGWGADLLGVVPGETLSFLPIIVLAIIFGLSSDYQIFVVSRIKEEHTGTGDARLAVENGIALSARVVTAAALIMFGVFAAFITVDNPILKPLAFTLAIGVLLDAFVVRLTLIPAVMAVIGNRIWYHPKWFDRYVPDFDVEGNQLVTTGR